MRADRDAQMESLHKEQAQRQSESAQYQAYMQQATEVRERLQKQLAEAANKAGTWKAQHRTAQTSADEIKLLLRREQERYLLSQQQLQATDTILRNGATDLLAYGLTAADVTAAAPTPAGKTQTEVDCPAVPSSDNADAGQAVQDATTQQLAHLAHQKL